MKRLQIRRHLCFLFVANIALPSFAVCHHQFHRVVLANNNLCIGPPPELQNLSLGEQLFIARGHALRRLRTLSHTGDPAARQTGLLGTTSAIAFPQDPVSLLSSLPPTPESLWYGISLHNVPVCFHLRHPRHLTDLPETLETSNEVQSYGHLRFFWS